MRLSFCLKAVVRRCSGAIHPGLHNGAAGLRSAGFLAAGICARPVERNSIVSRIAAGSLVAAWGKLFCLGGAALAVPVAAQSSDAAQSRAVVQPLPPAGVEELNTALLRLARNSRDLDALIDAGNASLRLNDIDAAIGFFGRADELSPGNPQVKIGLAGAFVRSERPLEALRLFDEAERAGASSAALAEERGLAYDLVGDPVSAQVQYARAIAARPNDEVTRRLALSQAISGDRTAFEKTLYPLLEQRNLAAYRTRAFGLAIMGDESEAVAIAEAVMPASLSAQMTPYLRYMNRLTKAQQAAAGNLGIFPRAAQIGRDDPRIAQYGGATSAAVPVRRADAALTPQGEPLGPANAGKSAKRLRPDRGTSAVPAAAPSPTVAATAVSATRVAVNPRPLVAVPAATGPTHSELPVTQAAPASQTAGPDFGPGPPATQAAALPPAPRAPQNSPIVQQIPAASPKAAAAGVSVADAFAGFSLESVAPDKTGAVDIAVIQPKRDVLAKAAPKAAPKPLAKPEPPKNPSRVWVQIATGRDRKALAFDWRRISRKMPDVLGGKAKTPVKPYITSWGQTNRLLAGPFAHEKAAQAAVAALKAGGLDSFTFTSAAGQAMDELP